jgi:putative Mn2+ efflux pump MntP
VDFFSILLIALGLAMDAFAVALCTGATGRRIWFRPGFRLSFHFGLFQFMMPIIGWTAGMTFVRFIEGYDHWIAFGLLAYVGGKMVKESFDKGDDLEEGVDPTRKWSLVMLAVATSIDALAVGLSMAMLKVPIFYPSIVIGLVAAGMTALGLALGCRLNTWGKRMELVGGLVLIGIGVRILISHIF